MDAIVYTSNTGYTKKYAQLLSDETQIPVFSLDEAESALKKGSDIIYLGWLMAGNVKGYKRAAELFNILALCAVGMAPPSEQMAETARKKYDLDGGPVFVLQGGYAPEKLTGFNKITMKTVTKAMSRDLTKKSSLSDSEKASLSYFQQGGNMVSKESLAPVLSWWGGLSR